jgi:hypothetical protein
MPDGLVWRSIIGMIRRKIRKFRNFRISVKSCSLVLTGLLLLFFTVEFGLNLWVRSALRRSLLQDSESGRVRIEKFDWLTPGDLLSGRFKPLKLDCWNCRIGAIAFEQLHVDSQGFRLDPLKLLVEKKLSLFDLDSTSITARITAKAATDYLRRDFAAFGPKVEFIPGGITVTGETELWQNRVKVRLSGGLTLSSPRMIRFFPERLNISGRQVPRDFLRYISGRIPLEVAVLQDWPFQITRLKLEPGTLIMVMREME